MTQPVAQPRHAVARSGFANPLTLGIKVTDTSFVKVYADDMLLQLGFDYTIDGLGDPAGIEITIIDGEDAGSYVGVDTFAAVFSPLFEQGADLSAGGNFGLAFESAIDALNRQIQALDDRLRRSLTLPPTYESDNQLSFPLPSAGRVLVGNATNTGFENGATLPEIETIVGLTDQIVLLTGIAPQIVEVAAVDSQIVALAPVAASIGALGPVAASVAALAPQAADIATLAPVAAEIYAVGQIPTQVATVSGIAAHVVTVSNNVAAVVDASNNMTAIIAAPGQADLARRWASEAVGVPVSSGLFSAFHYMTQTQIALAAATLPGAPVALNYLRRNAGNTAYETRTPAQVAADISALRYDAAQGLNVTQKQQARDNLGSAWELIEERATSPAVAAIDIINLAPFLRLRVTYALRVNVAAAGVFLRSSTNNGASFDAGAADYRYRNVGTAAAAAVQVSELYLYAGNMPLASYSYGVVEIDGFNRVNEYAHFDIHGDNYRDSGPFETYHYMGRRESFTARNALRLVASTGNIDGRFLIEGRRG